MNATCRGSTLSQVCVAGVCSLMTTRKPKLLASLLSPVALGLVLLVAASACGGGTFSSGGNVSSGGSASVGGASAIGSSGSGGAPDMGGATGSSGAPAGTGGALVTGGTVSLGGSVATGGTTAINTFAPCQQNSDCTVCKYDHTIASSTDCYCATCASTPMTRDECDSNHFDWTRYCGQAALACPAITCVARSAVCNNGVCTASTAATAGG